MLTQCLKRKHKGRLQRWKECDYKSVCIRMAITSLILVWPSLVARMVKNLPVIQETQIQPLGQKIPWKREWLPTPLFLPGEFCGLRILGVYKSMGLQRVRHNWATNTSLQPKLWPNHCNSHYHLLRDSVWQKCFEIMLLPKFIKIKMYFLDFVYFS